jgi:hypothetical protein
LILSAGESVVVWLEILGKQRVLENASFACWTPSCLGVVNCAEYFPVCALLPKLLAPVVICRSISVFFFFFLRYDPDWIAQVTLPSFVYVARLAAIHSSIL